jgi:hypothetical protein
MKEEEDLERICMNCNYYFPDSMDRPTEFGVCLNDAAFEPFLNELLKGDYDCCKELIARKKLDGNREPCSDFLPIETSGIEIDDDSWLGKEIKAATDRGELNTKTFERLVMEDQVRCIDLKTLPVDQYENRLISPDARTRDETVESVGSLATLGNKAAFKRLFTFLKELPTVASVDDVHLKMRILRYLETNRSSKSLKTFLIRELYDTPSNNITRQWISAILKVLSYYPLEQIRSPLEKLLREKQFSYRLKRKIRGLIDYDILWPRFE